MVDEKPSLSYTALLYGCHLTAARSVETPLETLGLLRKRANICAGQIVWRKVQDCRGIPESFAFLSLRVVFGEQFHCHFVLLRFRLVKIRRHSPAANGCRQVPSSDIT